MRFSHFMRFSRWSILLATVSLPALADVPVTPFYDEPQRTAQLATGTASEPDGASLPAVTIVDEAAPDEADAAEAAPDAATPEPPTPADAADADAVTLENGAEASAPQEMDESAATDESASEATQARSEAVEPNASDTVMNDGSAETDLAEPAQPSANAAPQTAAPDAPTQQAPAQDAEDQEGTQEQVGSSGSVATPETAPAPGADSTAPENAGNTGWTGGTGGAQLGTTPSGATPQSKTWQPPVATGIDLQGDANG